MVTRNQVIDTARDYLGVPYQHQGRTRNGLDCIGLAIVVAHDLGLTDFDIDGYGRVPSGKRMSMQLSAECTKLRNGSAKPGDLLHMAYEKQPQHIALVTDKGIIHADSQRGVVEHRLDSAWRARIRGAYRLPGVE